MISHKYKCIFIHIPRTAGTSIEKWIDGENWWTKKKEEKHLLASQARKIYSEYWDDYFKFAFVRNPWDRMTSYLKFVEVSEITYDGRLHFDKYKKKYGYPVIVENDLRFSSREEVLTDKHTEGCIYLNSLDEELDFIGTFENLKEDAAYIRKKLKIWRPFPINKKQKVFKGRMRYQDYYSKETIAEVGEMYKKDIEYFGYTF